uniref:IBR domain-containing protein n=1 Tax=Plectus sambesii TaxID=2011161 RepID=A0A914V7B2_9BILA
MCWLCGQLISGYDHFSTTNCTTFTIDQNDELYGILRRAERLNPAPPEEYVQMQQRLDENPELRQRTVRCPQCRQENLKREDRNNHIRCWSCRSSFCYRCRVRILPPITAHFANNRCPHHSDD